MVLKFNTTFFVISALLSGFLAPVLVYGETPSDSKRFELERQIQQLEQEADEFDKNLQQTQNEARTLANETKLVNTEIKRRELEIKRLTLAVRKTELEIQQKGAGIVLLSTKIERNRRNLGASLFLLYMYDDAGVLLSLLKNKTLSDFFGTIDNLSRVQKNVQLALDGFKDERTLLQREKTELEEFEKEQEDLKALQEVERRLLAQKKKEKDELLRLTRGKEVLFQQLLSLKKRDITTIKTQLFYLEKTGITAEDALRFADLAAKRAGIRTSFLLGLLEVETGRQFESGIISVGTNIGTGNWKADMSPKQYAAFLQITDGLNLDPNSMPVSARPCSKATRQRIGPGKPCGYGWGGAMGPAQFIPTTWLLFESRVALLTGHNPPNPWSIEDAFMASALFLADAGASSQTETGEKRAAKTYLSGRSNCNTSSCNSYARNVISAARGIEAIL